jgi:TonB-dependent receptor
MAGRTTAVVPGVGYLLSGTYGNSQETKYDELHATAVPGANGSTVPYNEFRGSSSSNSILWGGIANFSALLGGRTLLTLNNNYNRSADNEARQLEGMLDDFGFGARRSSLGFVERSVRSNQLRIERVIGSGQQLNASFTSSAVMRREPDKSELQYVREPDPLTGTPLPFALFSYNPEGARRTFSDLSESSLAGSLDYRISLGGPSSETQLKFGAAMRGTQRDADNSSYSLLAYKLTRGQREASAEDIFASPSSEFTILLNSTGGSYAARDRVGAAYAMIDLPVGSRIKLIGGARIEHADLEVTSAATSGERVTSSIRDLDVLPSFVANVSLKENQSLRLSLTRTLSRPEYRELSPVTYRDVIEQRDVFGNPELERTLITNLDARWEWFPSAGEIIGLGLFAKHFDKPIERVDVATSGASRLGFINGDAATNFGVELEVRKRFGMTSGSYQPITVFANGTVMKSTLDITNDQLSALTNRKRAMVGQAPFVVNAGASWSSASNKTTATLLYNIVGHRITAAGTTPLPDTYENARSGLDLSLQAPLFSSVSARLDARNLTDSPFEVRQGSVVRERYRVGRVLSLGINWQH